MSDPPARFEVGDRVELVGIYRYGGEASGSDWWLPVSLNSNAPQGTIVSEGRSYLQVSWDHVRADNGRLYRDYSLPTDLTCIRHIDRPDPMSPEEVVAWLLQ